MKKAIIFMKGEDESYIRDFDGEKYIFEDEKEMEFTYYDLLNMGYEIWKINAKLKILQKIS